jgi:hypothetical protein
MDTALSMSTTATARETGAHAAHGLAGLAHRIGVRLVEWSRSAEQKYTREYLAELHERRLEAQQLRDERFGNTSIARLL